MFERIKQMLIKEFIVMLRDPKMRPLIFLTPVVQLLLFGYAVTTDVTNVDVAVLDLDDSVTSRELVARFTESGYFTVVEYLHDEAEIAEVINAGKVTGIFRLNKGFGAAQEAGRTAELQVILDGTDSNTARIVADYASRIAQAYTREGLRSFYVRLTGTALPGDPLALETRAWFNENLEGRNYYVPGVIASLVLIITIMLSSMAIVREKEVGTMEQVVATPIRRYEFIIGKTIPFALVGYIDVILIMVVGCFWFGVPMRGSIILLFLGITLFLMSTLGMGLVISTVSHTQQQAMMSTFFVIMPFMMFSGFVFPIENMPIVIQYLTYLDPLRYMLIIVRGVFLKGIGIDLLWREMLALFLLGLATLFIATRRFHKTLS